MTHSNHKAMPLFTFLCLYIAQSIPMSFFSTVLPVIMRQQQFSLEVIAMLQFIKLPWILKFLWSPAIDRTTHRLGDYKRWIFSSEAVYAVLILAVSFLDFQLSPLWIVGLIVCAFIASATQDIATDALAAVWFDKENKSRVNSMQSIGSFGGAMIGGGVLLLLYKQIGWSSLLPFLALFVVVALIPLFFLRDTDRQAPLAKKEITKLQLNDWLGFFKKRGNGKQVVFLFLYNAGLIGILSLLKPLLVDYGYDMQAIGLMSGVVGTSVGCLTSFAGGYIVRRISRNTARAVFALFTLLTATYFYLLVTLLPVCGATLYLGIAMLWGCYGLVTIVVYTTSMDAVRPGYEGTDFTLQTVITHLSGMLMAVGAGRIAGRWGYDSLFLVEMGIAALSLAYVLFVFRSKKQKNV